MTQHDRSPRHGEAGFVLIGVVIFVLALTIIGISLFSLSSYEAQFLQRSIDCEQAFQSAVGCGLERARFVLALPGAILDSVQTSLPPGVVRTVAIQGEDSTGTIDWGINADSILIRVTAGRVGAQRMVEACFRPMLTQNYYSKLVTVGGGIEVWPAGPIPRQTDRSNTVFLGGAVWESSGMPTNAWTSILAAGPDSIRTIPLAPIPDTDACFAQHYAASQLARLIPGTPPEYELSDGGSGVRYYRSPGGNPNYSLFEPFDGDIPIRVRGLAVWLFPNGVRFDYRPTISGIGPPGENCLVIVAGPTGPSADPDDPDAGIWFAGGLDTQIPVVLVSSGKVLIWHKNNYEGGAADTRADDLAVFARSLSLIGPTVGTGTVVLNRQPGGLLDSHFLEQLVNDNALPNIGGRRLDLIPGTWHASDR